MEKVTIKVYFRTPIEDDAQITIRAILRIFQKAGLFLKTSVTMLVTLIKDMGNNPPVEFVLVNFER